MGVYGSFVVDVILAICDYLDIWCLTIKHPGVDPKESARRAEKVRRERTLSVESAALDGANDGVDGKKSVRGKKGGRS